MTYNKWPSPHGHAIASDKTDKMIHPLADIGGTAIDALERAQNQIGNKYWDGVKVNIAYALDLLRAQTQVAGGDDWKSTRGILKPYLDDTQPEAAKVALDACEYGCDKPCGYADICARCGKDLKAWEAALEEQSDIRAAFQHGFNCALQTPASDGVELLKNEIRRLKRLFHLAEECSEVIKVASKSARFGEEYYNPATGNTNAYELKQECADVSCLIDETVSDGDAEFIDMIQTKREKVKKWMTIEEECLAALKQSTAKDGV